MGFCLIKQWYDRSLYFEIDIIPSFNIKNKTSRVKILDIFDIHLHRRCNLSK